MNPVLLVDTHVHVYPGFRTDALLDAAQANFSAAAVALGSPGWQGFLLLTESLGMDWFGHVADRPGGRDFGAWHVEPEPGDDLCLRAICGARSLHIIAGRQVATAERLELHAFGTRARLADGLPLHRSLAEARSSALNLAIPWGAGKWQAARRTELLHMLASPEGAGVALSDNRGRPWWWREDLLVQAGDRPLLRGSDPLPLAGEERRVGSFGCWIAAAGTPEAPSAAIMRAIFSSPGGQRGLYGSRESSSGFLRTQLLLRSGRRLDINGSRHEW